MENKKIIQGKYITVEIIEHYEQDIQDFDMDNEMTSKVIIPEIVFAVNHNKVDSVDAQEELRKMIKLYIIELSKEISKI